MKATETLRKDHQAIKRLEKVIEKCYQQLDAGKEIPFSDIEKITIIISEFLDSIHYSREENSYFPCVASYDTLKKEIRTLLIEHEFARRIARNISKHLKRWKMGENGREPVARFLRTYVIYLNDHLSKEENLFDKVEKTVLSKEEEQEMYDQFKSIVSISKKIEDMTKEIDFLEQQPWFKNQ